jgi:hypothetical protein
MTRESSATKSHPTDGPRDVGGPRLTHGYRLERPELQAIQGFSGVLALCSS